MNNIWQHFQKPKRLEIEKDTLCDTYSKFIVEPFEKGFGTTVGNSLRRFLLSSIEGTAVTSLKIDGVYHEFSYLPGVIEDVTTIILNIKELRFKMEGNEPVSVHLTANKKGPVTAGNISSDKGIQILNPDHVIATLDKDVDLNIEMTVSKGRGYTTAEKNAKSFANDVQMIPVDSVFSPVKKVNFNVQNTRVGQSNEYDRLILEVWTDGSIVPEDAVAQASKILKEHIQLLINFNEEPEKEEPKVDDKKLKIIENLNKSVEELELSVRSYNCLMNADIKTIGELVQKTDADMLKTRNFGRKSLNEIKEILVDMGLSLGMKIDELELTPEEAELLKKKNEQNNN